MALQVYTGRIGHYFGDDQLDVTIKTGDIVFAPSWPLVMGFRAKEISPEAYLETYTTMMRNSYVRNRPRWDWLLAQEQVTLLCYCPAGDFCHRLILADILVKLGAEKRGEH